MTNLCRSTKKGYTWFDNYGMCLSVNIKSGPVFRQYPVAAQKLFVSCF